MNAAKSSSEEQYYQHDHDETTCDEMSELCVDNQCVPGADYENMNNELSSLCVGRDARCKSPSSCDYVTPKLTGMNDTGNNKVHFGIHALNNTKLKDKAEQVNVVKPYRVEVNIEGKSMLMEV